MGQAIEQRVRKLIIAQLYHLETYERLMDHFEDNEGDQLDEAINKIARETMYAPGLLSACELWLGAVQHSLGLRLALTSLPEGAGPVLVEMLQEAITKVKGDQCSV